MISIKYDFPPPTIGRECAASSSLRGLHLFLSTSVALFAPASPSLFHFPPSPSHPFDSPSPRGGNPGLNPFPYNFLPMHREKLARNTHAHARTPGARFSYLPSPSLFHALARSPARWRSPIIRFHRIFVVRAQASGPDMNPPINPVSVWRIRN